MRNFTKLTCALSVATTFAFTSAPARAQFEGAGDQMAQFAPMMEQLAPMMEQFAPMMPTMMGKVGGKRMGRIMGMPGPMMAGMMPPGGGFAGFAGMPDMGGAMGMMGMMGMPGGGPTGRARARYR